jgi:hypothetical protein
MTASKKLGSAKLVKLFIISTSNIRAAARPYIVPVRLWANIFVASQRVSKVEY